MTLFNTTQIADLSSRCTAMLDKMKTVARAGDASPETGDLVRHVLHDLRDLAVVYGQPGIGFAVRTWFDAVIDATPGAGRGNGKPTTVMFVNEQQTQLVHRISPEHQWAGDALAARFSDDQTGLYRLLGAIPHGATGIVCLFRAIEVSAVTIVAHENPAVGPIKPGLYQAVST